MSNWVTKWLFSYTDYYQQEAWEKDRIYRGDEVMQRRYLLPEGDGCLGGNIVGGERGVVTETGKHGVYVKQEDGKELYLTNPKLIKRAEDTK